MGFPTKDILSEPSGLSARAVIEHMAEGVLVTNAQGLIQAVNSSFCRMTGYSAEEMMGQNPRILQSGQHNLAFYKRMWRSILKKGRWSGEIRNRRKNGEFYTEHLTVTAMKDAQGRVTHYMGVFTDISKRKRAEEIIRHMAYHDVLTDLPNRILFIEHLNQALAQARRNHNVLAVLFLDLDRIKTINDSLGHDVGDRLLQQVAARIKSSLREIDTVARLGGDEFMILLPLAKNPLDASKTAQKILNALRPAFTVEKHEIYITASVGISLYPCDGTDSLSLMRNADAAMYQAKRQGRNTYRVFMPTMQATLLQQISLANDFRRALEHQEFVVYYQPQVNIKSGAITGMEALARWKHPKLGLLPPSEFIPWAEDAGWIVPLGTHVLKTACAQDQNWVTHGFPNLRVSVNVSVRQFKRGHLVETVSQVLHDTQLPPDHLRLELTESGIMGTSESEAAIPRDLKSIGVGLSLDDFGMGYASLNYLRRFPITSIKIDPSFVRDLASDANAVSIVKAVIALGHALELTVIAEGVETEDQLTILRELGCDEMQGFLISKPIPAESIEQFFRERKLPHKVALN